MSNFWLLKVEPSDYAFAQLRSDKSTVWNGIRNAQAQKYLREMKLNDLALYYHTEKEKSIVGIVKISKEFYCLDDPKFGMVDVEYVRELKKPVTLIEIKETEKLKSMTILKQPRLSVSPITVDQWNCVLKLSETD